MLLDNIGTMALYYFISLIVIALVKKNVKIDAYRGHGSHWHVPAFVAVVVLALLATLRSQEVGSDTAYYVNEFLAANTRGLSAVSFGDIRSVEQEYGYRLVTILLRKITDNYHIYFLIIYSFVAFSYINFMINTASVGDFFPIYQIFIVYYVMNMSGLRAAIMTGFLLFSFVALKKNRIIKAIVLTLFAALFHLTGIINLGFILIGLVVENKNRKLKRWKWIVLTLVCVIVSNVAITMLRSLFVGTRYQAYTMINMEDRSFLGSVFYLFTFVCCFIFFKWLAQKLPQGAGKKTEAKLTLSLAVAYPGIYLINAYRIPNYFILPRLSILSSITSKFVKKQKNRILGIGIWLLVICYMLFHFSQMAEVGNFKYVFWE